MYHILVTEIQPIIGEITNATVDIPYRYDNI